MTETVTPTRSHARVRRTLWLDALVVLAWLAVSIPLMRSLEDPPRAEFRIRNDTAWNLSLYVETGPGSVMPVAAIGAERAKLMTEVLVPGETWKFTWRFAGDVIGRSTIAHDDLRDPSFVLTVPDDVEQALRASGAPPAP